MTIPTKRFIAPGGWFEMNYPMAFTEFLDEEGSFLFYDPDTWTGNFRIAAYKGSDKGFARRCVDEELAMRRRATIEKVGTWRCCYYTMPFTEQEERFVDHCWVFGERDMVYYVRLTVFESTPADLARQIIATVATRHPDRIYPAEVIDIRAKEVQDIEEAYDTVRRMIKEKLSRDFRGEPEDVALLQRLVEEGGLNPRKRDAWLALGIALAVVVANNQDQYRWMTLVDGNREDPVLQDVEDGTTIDPMHLVWSKVKRGQNVNLVETYAKLTEENA